MNKKVLGVLGGMGPAASAHFYTLITKFTKASCDGEHMKLLLFSAPDIPDRTGFIIGKSKTSPLPAMQKAVSMLAREGAEIIAVPCNTAEYFHAALQGGSPIPILRTAYECAAFSAECGVRRIGIMATEGTVRAGIYHRALAGFGIEPLLPSERGQKALHGIIYGSVKKSLPPNKLAFRAVADELASRGCDAIILGCTELSLVPLEQDDEKYNFIDSLTVLAKKSITACGYEVRT